MVNCKECKKEFVGRLDKKFCSSSCKSAFNNKLHREENKEVNRIIRHLKNNRKLLKKAIGSRSTNTVYRVELERLGYNFRYSTDQLTTNKNDHYIFTFEYGILEISNDRILVVKKSSMVK
jgi:hypothetical protein